MNTLDQRLTVAKWLPVDAPIQCKPPIASADRYLAVVNQLEVQSNPRYQPTPKDTFCNLFVWDVTRNMGVEIPHWVDAVTGAPARVGHGVELNVNATVEWLERYGRTHGWEPSTRTAGELLARSGVPTVVLWKNPTFGGHGHIAMLIPGPERILTIAQAGRQNYASAPLARGFGNLDVSFYAAKAYVPPPVQGVPT